MKRLFSVILLFATLASMAYAGDQDIVISEGPYRTSPCFQYNNYWFGSIVAPVSKDGDYFWGYESEAFTYPSDGPVVECRNETGRGFVYGTVANLASYSGVAAFKTKIKQFPAGCTINNNAISPLYWSKKTGEYSIIYANCNDGTIKKMDASAESPSWSTVCDWSDIGK